MLDDILSERTSERLEHLLRRCGAWLMLHSLLDHSGYVLSLWLFGAVTVDLVELSNLTLFATLPSRCILLFYHIHLTGVIVSAVIYDIVMLRLDHTVVQYVVNAVPCIFLTHGFLIRARFGVFLFGTVENRGLFFLTMVNQGVDLLNYAAQLLLLS